MRTIVLRYILKVHLAFCMAWEDWSSTLRAATNLPWSSSASVELSCLQRLLRSWISGICFTWPKTVGFRASGTGHYGSSCSSATCSVSILHAPAPPPTSALIISRFWEVEELRKHFPTSELFSSLDEFIFPSNIEAVPSKGLQNKYTNKSPGWLGLQWQ